MNPTPGLRPSWVDSTLFPFESRFVEIDDNVVHYVDEDAGPVLVMLHGNPAWSFLYRRVILALRAEFRCIAIDYPGFGLSSAHEGYRYLPSEHAAVVLQFIQNLDLKDVTLVANDWGGPIGLWAAGQDGDRFARFVIGNTWAWPVAGDLHFEWFSKAMGGAIGRLLIRRFNLFVNLLVPAGHKQTRLSSSEMAHYRAALPTPGSRLPTAVFPREITRSAPWLRQVEAGLRSLADRPALVIWGARDFAFRSKERERFEAHFPIHQTVILKRAGHFIADDAPVEVSEAIRAWMRQVGPPPRPLARA